MRSGTVKIKGGAVYTLEDGKWSGPDPDVVQVLQDHYELVNRSPAEGDADRGHVLDMADLMEGVAELPEWPEDDDGTIY